MYLCIYASVSPAAFPRRDLSVDNAESTRAHVYMFACILHVYMYDARYYGSCSREKRERYDVTLFRAHEVLDFKMKPRDSARRGYKFPVMRARSRESSGELCFYMCI